MRFGYTIQDWEAAREKARRIMRSTAAKESTISYSELVANLDLIPPLEPDDYAVAQMLDEISISDEDEGLGLLSVVVVHKGSDGMPGNGFFELARRKGRRFSDHDEFWVTELRRVYATWKPSS